MKVEEAEVENPASTKAGKKVGSKWWKVSSVTGVWKNFKAAVRAARIKHFENLISAGLPGEVNLIMFDEIEEPERQPPRFKGVRQLDKTGRWVSEIRPTVGLYTNHKKKKIWLGSFGTPEEAARAFDVTSAPLLLLFPTPLLSPAPPAQIHHLIYRSLTFNSWWQLSMVL